MELFNRQDEEDDFKGVPRDSRTEIQQVGAEMRRHIQKMNRRFLVIFHNGSSEEIDLANFCGFPLSGYSTNKHCWDKLRVLKLSRCTFNFQSPPFICCHSLRFLWLDHCQGTQTSTDRGARKEEDVRRCFQRLWVLDGANVIGAQHWDMGQLQGRLPNIRKLRTVKIRGCWSLKSLPYVGRGSNNKVVECDCEKEWWDRLEWEDSSQANRYKPIHSRYYKKTMLRASFWPAIHWVAAARLPESLALPAGW
nr:unnamed protein product [Digitaria exilis]